MDELSEAEAGHLQLLATVEHNTERLLPLLGLLDPQEGPDRIEQLTELLRLLIDMQQRQAIALKSIADKLDYLSRR